MHDPQRILGLGRLIVTCIHTVSQANLNDCPQVVLERASDAPRICGGHPEMIYARVARDEEWVQIISGTRAFQCMLHDWKSYPGRMPFFFRRRGGGDG